MLLRSVLICSTMLSLCLMGCGGSELERPAKVYEVSGHVTWKGNPVTNADVTFFNIDANRSAFGRTDNDGFYRLTTFASNDGAVEGRHTVTVVKPEAVAPATEVASIESEAYVPPTAGRSVKPAKPKDTLPEVYATQATTTLVGVVKPEDGNVVDLTLE